MRLSGYDPNLLAKLLLFASSTRGGMPLGLCQAQKSQRGMHLENKELRLQNRKNLVQDTAVIPNNSLS